jgi:uncharacterized protein YjiS (DUF1127 family)
LQWNADMTTAHMLEITRRQDMGLVERLCLRLSENMRRRALRNQLLNLGDHVLRDVGLTRENVQSDIF